MRIILLFLSIIIAGVVTHAQTRSDFIYRLDQTGFSAIIDEIGETDIIYFLTTDTAKRTPVRIARAQVWKLIYANGDIEIINTPITSSSTPRSKVNETPDQIFLKNKTTLKGKVLKISEQSIEYRQKDNGPVYELSRNEVTKIEYSNGEVRAFEEAVKNSKGNTSITLKDKTKTPKLFSGFHNSFGLYLKSTYVLPATVWGNNDLGYGFTNTIGGGLFIDRKLSKKLSMTLDACYQQWGTITVYKNTDNQTDIRSIESKLMTIPLLFGLKLYIIGGFFIEPKLGGSAIRLNVINEGTINTFKDLQLCAGTDIGYTFNKRKRLPLSIGISYTGSNIKNTWSYWYGSGLLHTVNLTTKFGLNTK